MSVEARSAKARGADTCRFSPYPGVRGGSGGLFTERLKRAAYETCAHNQPRVGTWAKCLAHYSRSAGLSTRNNVYEVLFEQIYKLISTRFVETGACTITHKEAVHRTR